MIKKIPRDKKTRTLHQLKVKKKKRKRGQTRPRELFGITILSQFYGF